MRRKDLLPGKDGAPGVTAQGSRLFLNAVPGIGRPGAPWPDLPERFGKYNPVWRRFGRWAQEAAGERVARPARPRLGMAALGQHHRPRPPARRGRKQGGADGAPSGQARGRSRGGFPPKIHAAVSGLGLPVAILRTPGQRADGTQAQALVRGHEPEAVLAGQAFDRDAFLAVLRAKGAPVVIPPQANRLEQRTFDRPL